MKPLTIIMTDRKGATAIWGLMIPIANALVEQGHKVVFCRLNDGQQRHSLPVPKQIEVIDIEVPPNQHLWDFYVQHRTFSNRFQQILEQLKPDIVHTNFAIPAISVRLIAHQQKVPVILSTQHELYSSMSSHLRLGMKLTEKWVDAIVSVSETVAHSFGYQSLSIETPKDSEANQQQKTVIYNGIDIASIKNRRLVEKEPHKLICVGRFVPVKGQAILLQAMPKLLSHFPDIKLVLIGAGTEEFALKKQVEKLGIAKNVQFRGWLSHEETIAEMATAEILVVPSTGEQEGFGLVVAEGMALGIPIVTSDIQVFREVLGKDDQCGWFFEKKNPESLAKTIGQVFSQREEAKLRANNALSRVQEKFSIERMVKEYLTLYETLAQNINH